MEKYKATISYLDYLSDILHKISKDIEIGHTYDEEIHQQTIAIATEIDKFWGIVKKLNTEEEIRDRKINEIL